MNDMSMIAASRLAAVISPLRRGLLGAAREREQLPDIPDAQIEIIRALPHGTAATPGELATTLGLGRPTVSNLLASMERRGLVARRARSDDRRRVDVVATPAALGFFERFDRASAALVAEAATALTPDESRALAVALPALEKLRDEFVRLRRDDEVTPEKESA